MTTQLAKAKQIQVEASSATGAGTLQELIEANEIYRETNITVTQGEDSISIESSTGTSGAITSATTTASGVMSKDDKVKLNELPTRSGLTTELGTIENSITALDTSKVDKEVGKSLALDTELSKLAGYPAVSVINSSIDTKVSKETGKELIPTVDLNKLNALPTSVGLSSSFDLKVDKVVGKSLVGDTEILKLAALRDDATITTDLLTKVDKVTGKALSEEDFTTALKIKVEGLRGDSITDTLLDGKVDKEVGKGLIDPSPIDGKIYGRYNGGWTQVTGGGGGTGDVEEAPIDGKQYARKDAAWSEVANAPSSFSELTDVGLGSPYNLNNLDVLTWNEGAGEWTNVPRTAMSSVQEAPSDGLAYSRVSGNWQQTDAPYPVSPADDGKPYARIANTWVAVPSFPTANAQFPHWLLSGQVKYAYLKDLPDVSWGTPTDGQVLSYDTSSSKVKFVTPSGGSGGGVEEAPNNFFAYVRKGNAWVVGVEGGATTVKAGASSTATGSNGVAIGNKSTAAGASSVAIGSNARSRRGSDIAIGDNAHSYDSPLIGAGKIAIGASSYTNGDGAIALGKGSTALFDSGVAIGPTTTCGSTNEIRIGNASAIVKVQSAIVEVSDARDKADIQPHTLGLNFIKLLEPVKWKADPRSAYAPKREDFDTDELYQIAIDSWDEVSFVPDGTNKGARFKHGLIAQQVKESLDLLGEDFSGYVDDSITAGGNGNKALAYASFISPLILAVQQLSDKVDALEQQVADLQGV